MSSCLLYENPPYKYILWSYEEFDHIKRLTLCKYTRLVPSLEHGIVTVLFHFSILQIPTENK